LEQCPNVITPTGVGREYDKPVIEVEQILGREIFIYRGSRRNVHVALLAVINGLSWSIRSGREPDDRSSIQRADTLVGEDDATVLIELDLQCIRSKLATVGIVDVRHDELARDLAVHK